MAVMLTNNVQWFAVALIVAGAVGYLSLALWKSARGGACGGCHHAKALQTPPDAQRESSSPARQFVPVELLSDLARRRSEERLQASAAPPAAPSAERPADPSHRADS